MSFCHKENAGQETYKTGGLYSTLLSQSRSTFFCRGDSCDLFHGHGIKVKPTVSVARKWCSIQPIIGNEANGI